MPKIDKTAPVAGKTYVVTAKYMHVAQPDGTEKVIRYGARIKGEELPAKLLRTYLKEEWLIREEDWQDDPADADKYAETDEVADDAE